MFLSDRRMMLFLKLLAAEFIAKKPTQISITTLNILRIINLI